jgi:hypothetical protein
MTFPRRVLLACLIALSAMPSGVAANIDIARDLVNKGNYLMASGKFTEALKMYEEAKKYEPGNAVIRENIAKVYNNWALSYIRQNKYYEAKEKLEKCLELSPGYANARTNMAILRRRAEEEGIDLETPPQDESKNLPKIPDVPKLPDGGQLPKVAPVAPEGPQAGAVLFIGGVKQPVVPETPVAPATPQVDAFPTSATSEPPASGPSFVTPVTSGPSFVTPATNPPSTVVPAVVTTPAPTPSAAPATFVAKPANPLFPTLPTQFVEPPPRTSAATSAPAAPATPVVSFDEQLTAVEMKVYGAKQTNLTVLQRLEKIEKDSAGQIRTGTILERINYLKSAYGL